MIKCPKEYKIPTNDWLIPIKVLIDEYNLENSKNLIYESELIEDEIKRENILVKVSKVDTLLNTTERAKLKNLRFFSFAPTIQRKSEIFFELNNYINI
jgi:hypothetical protein